MIIKAPAYSIHGGTEYIAADKVELFYGISFNGRHGTEVILSNGARVQLSVWADDFSKLLAQALPAPVASSIENTVSPEEAFWLTWEDAISRHPFLLVEIGYTRATDWMVHIWNSEGTGIKNAPKIITTQRTSRADAMTEAANQLRDLFNLDA